jgi:hypothetical protein
MEPLSLLVVAVSALAASVVKPLIKGLFTRMGGGATTRTLEITTAAGKKVTIDASQLTQEKVAEITDSHSTVHAF